MTTKNGFDILFKGRVVCQQTVCCYNISASDLYCEDGPPTDIADRLNASFPHFMNIELAGRSTAQIAGLDRFVKLIFGL